MHHLQDGGAHTHTHSCDTHDQHFCVPQSASVPTHFLRYMYMLCYIATTDTTIARLPHSTCRFFSSAALSVCNSLFADIYFARGSGCEVLWWVCLSVCRSARISPEPDVPSLPNVLCTLPMSVARSSFGTLTIGRIAYRQERVTGVHSAHEV